MFSFFKKQESKPSRMLIFEDNELDELRGEINKELTLFDELRHDFQLLLLSDNIDLFVKGGPVEHIDETMKKFLLPDKKASYLNIMGSIRFIRLHSRRQTKDMEKVAIELFESVVQGDSDIISDIISAIESNVALKSKSDISDVASSGQTIVLMIGDGIFTGSDDIEVSKKQINEINDLKFVAERIKIFFKIVSAVNSEIVSINSV